MSNFWKELPAQFLGLSPMDGVTDQPFRAIQAKYGKPAVMYTEFTCVEGITHGATRLLKDFLYDDTQRPIVAQIFGHTPADFRTVATIVCALGFDGVDINMGCPAKTVTHVGSGAALIQTPELAKEIVKATKAGVQDWVDGIDLEKLPLSPEIIEEVKSRMKSDHKESREHIPVSIKTRMGFDSPVIEDWISSLLETEPVAIAIHGRLLKQYYGGEADWDEIKKAVDLAKDLATLIIGNGDVKSLQSAKVRFAETGVDGILIGRATMGNPWLFTDEDVAVEQRCAVAIEHSKLYEQTFQHDQKYSFMPMRKHLGWYIKEFPGASEIRQRLVLANSASEVETILNGVRG